MTCRDICLPDSWVEFALAVISALLTVLTMAWPDWIEGLFEVDPDAGSGSSEWGITLAFFVATVALAAFDGTHVAARSQYRSLSC